MPSYKHKYELLKLRLDAMDNRVLLNASILNDLRNKIEELTDENFKIRDIDKPSTNAKNQLYLAIAEIEELIHGERRVPADLVHRGSEEAFALATESLHAVARLLRDSHVRAQTILDGLDLPNNGKLLKRERREELRKASVSSLAASVAVTPPRALSPPDKTSVRSDSPLRHKLFGNN